MARPRQAERVNGGRLNRHSAAAPRTLYLLRGHIGAEGSCMTAMDMYQEVILQHYRTPRNFGPLDPADRVGEESNPLCGDHITIRLKLDPSAQRIESVKFEGDGCAISMASTSMLTERLVGASLEDAGRITQDDVMQKLGIPLSPVRIKCALTGYVALGRALHPELSVRAH